MAGMTPGGAMAEDRAFLRDMTAGAAALVDRARMAEQREEAACAELQRVLDGLPYRKAKTGKNAKLRRRLTRFLSERLKGI